MDGRLSDEFLASVPGLTGSPEKGRRSDIDNEALAAFNSGVRFRKTSSEAVMQMLAGEEGAPAPGAAPSGGGVQLARTSSDALMTFLKESEV